MRVRVVFSEAVRKFWKVNNVSWKTARKGLKRSIRRERSFRERVRVEGERLRRVWLTVKRGERTQSQTAKFVDMVHWVLGEVRGTFLVFSKAVGARAEERSDELELGI